MEVKINESLETVCELIKNGEDNKLFHKLGEYKSAEILKIALTEHEIEAKEAIVHYFKARPDIIAEIESGAHGFKRDYDIYFEFDDIYDVYASGKIERLGRKTPKVKIEHLEITRPGSKDI